MEQNKQNLGSHKTTVYTDEQGVTRVVYYDTAVVTFDDAEIILNTGDWWTRSTKGRMNRASEHFDLGYRVYQKGNVWYIAYHDAEHQFATEQVRLDRQTGEVQPLS